LLSLRAKSSESIGRYVKNCLATCSFSKGFTFYSRVYSTPALGSTAIMERRESQKEKDRCEIEDNVDDFKSQRSKKLGKVQKQSQNKEQTKKGEVGELGEMANRRRREADKTRENIERDKDE